MNTLVVRGLAAAWLASLVALTPAGVDAAPSIAGIAQISSPAAASTVSGQVEIRGTANLPRMQFGGYRLHWGPVDDLTTLIQIGGDHADPVSDRLLETWDTSNMAEGPYALLLTVWSTDGRTYKNGAVVNVRSSAPSSLPTPPTRPTITSPLAGAVLQGTAPIKGTVGFSGGQFPEVFQFYKVEYAPIASPAGRIAVSSIQGTPVVNGTLDSWDTTQAADGGYWLIASVVRASGQFQETRVPVFVRNTPVGRPR